MLLVGATGYVQNAAGGSISEEAAPLLTVTEVRGRLVKHRRASGFAPQSIALTGAVEGRLAAWRPAQRQRQPHGRQ